MINSPYDPNKLPDDLRAFLPPSERKSVVVPALEFELESGKSYAQVDPLVLPQAVLPKGRASAEPKHKRVVPLSVRFSEVEKEVLRRKARVAGISLHAYVRATSLGSDFKPAVDPLIRKELLVLNRELTAQGNNLNQVTKHLNIGDVELGEGEGIVHALAWSINRTLRMVRRLLSKGAEVPL